MYTFNFLVEIFLIIVIVFMVGMVIFTNKNKPEEYKNRESKYKNNTEPETFPTKTTTDLIPNLDNQKIVGKKIDKPKTIAKKRQRKTKK